MTAGQAPIVNNDEGRQSRESWIIAAFETLGKEGVEQVRVEKLARKLGITKGSFYWHFTDRADLLNEVLKYWTNDMTQTVIDHTLSVTDDPIQRIYTTTEDIVSNEKSRFDPHIKAWARNDPEVAKIVQRVDQLRLDFICQLFLDTGFDKEEAESRGRLLYYYLLGEHINSVIEPMNIRLEKLHAKVDLLTADLK